MSASFSSAETGGASAAPAWRRLVDPDRLYRWATLLVLPAFVIWPGFKSEVFAIYAVLFAFQVWRNGYLRSGLEP